MVTLWQGRWYFSWYGAMVVGVPLRDTPNLNTKNIEKGDLWDALELVTDEPQASVTIR